MYSHRKYSIKINLKTKKKLFQFDMMCIVYRYEMNRFPSLLRLNNRVDNFVGRLRKIEISKFSYERNLLPDKFNGNQKSTCQATIGNPPSKIYS